MFYCENLVQSHNYITILKKGGMILKIKKKLIKNNNKINLKSGGTLWQSQRVPPGPRPIRPRLNKNFI